MSNIKHSQKQRQGVVIQPDATILSGIVPRKTEKLFSRVLPTLIFHVADFLYGIWPWKSRGQTPERRSPHLTNPNPFQTQQVFFLHAPRWETWKTFRVECGHACHVTPLVYDYCLEFCGSPAEFQLALWISVVNYFKTKFSQICQVQKLAAALVDCFKSTGKHNYFTL